MLQQAKYCNISCPLWILLLRWLSQDDIDRGSSTMTCSCCALLGRHAITIQIAAAAHSMCSIGSLCVGHDTHAGAETALFPA